jgi:hypothetical protein
VSASTSVPTTTCTLAAAADTYADGALLAASSNFGTAATLAVRTDTLGNKRSFVRFDTTACASFSSADVKSARLELYLATAPAASRTYTVHRVTASWAETSLTWNNQPGVAGSASDSVATGTTNGDVLTWSVTADVQGFVNGTFTNQGWRIADSAEGAVLAREGLFASREAGTATQRPRLVVTYYP